MKRIEQDIDRQWASYLHDEGRDERSEQEQNQDIYLSRLWSMLLFLLGSVENASNSSYMLQVVKTMGGDNRFPHLHRHLWKSNQSLYIISLCRLVERPSRDKSNDVVNVSIYSFLEQLEEHYDVVTDNGRVFPNEPFGIEVIQEARTRLNKHQDSMNALFMIRNKLEGHTDYEYALNQKRIMKDVGKFQERHFMLYEECRDIVREFFKLLCFHTPESFNREVLIADELKHAAKVIRSMNKRP